MVNGETKLGLKPTLRMSSKHQKNITRENINRWKTKTGRETMFLHKCSGIGFDCFPRSKSTLIGSNIFSNNYNDNNKKQDNRYIRRKIVVSKENINLTKKVLCLRCPEARFRSYLLSKIVNPHATSILSLFYSDYPEFVKYMLVSREGIKCAKSLKTVFEAQKLDSARDSITEKIMESRIVEKVGQHRISHIVYFLEHVVHAYKKMKTKDILKSLKVLDESNIYLDAHSMSQYSLATFDINQYDYILSVDRLEEFAIYYKELTGFDLAYGKENKSQNNTFITHKEEKCEDPNIEYLQARLQENVIPELGSVLNAGESLWQHFKLFEKDYIITSKFKEGK